MSPGVIRDFEHFLGYEHDNIGQNVAALGDGYALIHDLDTLYCTCIAITLPDEEHLKIPAFLYLISHQEFYYAMASFLRLHRTQSFRSLRVALDSTFTAYYLLRNPDEIDLYLSRSAQPRQWESIFRNIKLTIRNNSKQFPHATGLFQVHDMCSKFAHADPAGILHKYFMDTERKILHVDYFDFENSAHDYKKWFSFFLYYFFRIFLIYWHEMLTKYAGPAKTDVARSIRDYKDRMKTLRAAYSSQQGIS